MDTSYRRLDKEEGPLRQGLLVRRTSFHAPGTAEDETEKRDAQEQKARDKNTCQHLWRLFKAIGPEKWWIILASLSAVIQVGMSLVQPKLTGDFFNELYVVVGSSTSSDLSSAHYYLKLMGGFYALQIVFSLLTGSLFGIAARKIVARLRITLFSRYLAQEMGFFDQKSVGELISRLQTDVGLLQTITTTFSSLLNIIITVAGSLVWMFQIDWRMTLISLASAPFLAFFSVYFGNLIRKKTTLSFDFLAMQNQCAQEVLSYIRTVRGYDQEIREGNRYMSLTMRVYRIGLQLLAISQLYGLCDMVVSYTVSVMIFLVGGNFAINGIISPGDLVAFISYSSKISGSVKGLSGLYTSLMRTVGGTLVLVSLLERMPDGSENKGRVEGVSLDGHIRFDGVTFSYPSRPNQVALRNVSLDFPAGKATAIVGPSGSGKSSLLSILLKFYRVNEGVVKLDEHNLEEIDAKWIRKNIAIVTQEPVIFTGTVMDNIMYGSMHASELEVVDAAQKANAHEFIMALPQQYHTLIGAKHTQLSGGQKQRIAIARALVKNARILLLDEATSALDAHSEQEVQRALDELMVGRTTLMISHRLNTIMKADRVVVLDRGEVVEEGTQEELMEAGGMFAGMVNSQRARQQQMQQRGPGGAPASAPPTQQQQSQQQQQQQQQGQAPASGSGGASSSSSSSSSAE